MKGFKRLFKFLLIIMIIIIGGSFYMGIRYPLIYNDIVVRNSNEYNLDPYLVASIINVESSYDPDAISLKDAKGLMQIGTQTGKWASEVLEIQDYKEEMLFDPEINIKIGTWYLNRLYNEFNQDLDLVLMAYNAGSGNVSKWLNNTEYCKDGINIDNIPFNETKNYVEKVNKNYKVYKLIYGKSLINQEENNSYRKFISNIRKAVKAVIQ